MKKHFLFLFIVFYTLTLSAQQGGMWIPSLLKGRNESEMKNLGMKISAEEIYSVNTSSLKDAVPQYDRGCTGEMISSNGLMLTNHHCGYSEIQSHSTLEKNYIQEGFWAKTLSEELPNPNVVASFVIRIEDVTAKILKNTHSSMDAKTRNDIISQNINEVVTNTPKEAWQQQKVVPFYYGNQYLLFVEEVFEDIRLVGAPPASIGKFGSDTDNWVYPRHTGDFALFRIYADKNNRPAKYSKDNVPYKPKKFFPVSIAGVQEGDFTMVFGYPGRTEEYLPSVAVKQLVETINPARIEIRDVTLKIQGKYMRQDPLTKIQYAAKNASIANYWKKWKGENGGLIKTNALKSKLEYETKFKQLLIAKNKQQEYGQLLPNMEKLYASYLPYHLAVQVHSEAILRMNTLLSCANALVNLKKSYEHRGVEDADARESVFQRLKAEYKDYNPQLDKEVFVAVLEQYKKHFPKEFLPTSLQGNVNLQQMADIFYEKSILATKSKVEALEALSTEKRMQTLANDPAISFVSELSDTFYEKVYNNYLQLSREINKEQGVYMKAILEFATEKDRIFPDANSTLRVTYGKVQGYQPKDAIVYTPISYLEGVMEKYIPNDYEFDVPARLRTLYEQKDYGMYADKNGKMPVNFIATNHTTGGNSGSPAIDKHGNLIGLNFDRVWEGTMSDIHYDPAICRNIMVDMRYVLFIIDKYAGAGHLIREMELRDAKNKKVAYPK